ncbi:MAG TPA: hypothetical protein VNZ58_04430 [Thermomicrobiales bacterium]|nr:hypothetical protein [Thermomicrobiales bacterium]
MWNKSKHQDAEAEIVLLAVAQSEVEGQMWASTLRDAGVNVLVKSGGPGMGAWASAATFEHQLYVRQDQLARAQEILGPGVVTPDARMRARRQAPGVNRRSRRRPG